MLDRYLKASLLATTVIAGLAVSSPAMAQTTNPGATTDPDLVPTQPAEPEESPTENQAPPPGSPVQGVSTDTEADDTIIVTGTILRATAKATPSPVAVLDIDEQEKRGINTVNDAIQSISANSAGNLPNAFTANGAFAAGASAASLRGLLTSNTLVLFDGLRAAYYPLADDGTRNFVDLNTIPDAIVDRVEVLKDGASSTYGADAIAGVINIITKREIQGLHLGAEAGVTQRGDGGELRAEATYGIGDLGMDGFNVYASGMYFQQEGIENHQLGHPFNTGNLCDEGLNTGFAFNVSCNVNPVVQTAFLVRPSGPDNDVPIFGPDPDGDGPLEAPLLSPFQYLNPAAGCGEQPTFANTDGEHPEFPAVLCEEDWVANYFDVNADLERVAASLRGTVSLADSVEAYGMLNFVETNTGYTGLPTRLRTTTPPATSGLTFSTADLALPVYICPDGIDCETDPQRQLNPNNPFAAEGSQARIIGYVEGLMEQDHIRTRGYRGAAGITGSFGGDWRWGVDATAMTVKTTWTQEGYIYVANLLNAINTGSFNFVDPTANSQEQIDFISPDISNTSQSKMYQLQGNISKALFELPGGPLQVGIGASIRRESVNAPSANPDRDAAGNPLGAEDFEGLTPTEIADLVDETQRFTRANPFGAIGKRTVKSAYAEALAPIIPQLDVNVSGRYDSYSTGQDAFSPKVGVKFTPVREIAFRGTWSKGFRIGSFGETASLPTTGYITGTNTVPDAYAALFPGGRTNDYLASYSLGLTQLGNPDLEPEKSRNFTIGVVAEPIRNVSFSVDYWNIKKDDVIVGADYSPALAAYYAGQPIPDGFTIIPDEPDPDNPNILPRVAFVQYSYTNAASQKASGIDFAAAAEFDIGNGMTFSSNLEASRMLELQNCFDTGCQEFVGTIGPYVITSASGTPKWRGSWQNVLEFGNAYTSLTAFYTSGYKTTAEDIFGAGTGDDCDTNLSLNGDCTVSDTLYFNLAAGVDVTEAMNLYVNINNLLDEEPPLDYATYGGYLYNPSWSHPMAIGRFFRVGAKIKM